MVESDLIFGRNDGVEHQVDGMVGETQLSIGLIKQRQLTLWTPDYLGSYGEVEVRDGDKCIGLNEDTASWELIVLEGTQSRVPAKTDSIWNSAALRVVLGFAPGDKRWRRGAPLANGWLFKRWNVGHDELGGATNLRLTVWSVYRLSLIHI